MKKSWHFKKWFQTIIEVIMATSLLLAMAVADVSNINGFIILFGLLAIAGTGALLLTKYGRF